MTRRDTYLVSLWVRAETADGDLPSLDCLVGIDHHRQERILELLVQRLRSHVDTRQPAAVARVRVIPPDTVVGHTIRPLRLQVLDDVFVRLTLRVHPRLGSLDGEWENVEDMKRAIHNLPHQHAHDFEHPAALGVNAHLPEARERTGERTGERIKDSSRATTAFDTHITAVVEKHTDVKWFGFARQPLTAKLEGLSDGR